MAEENKVLKMSLVCSICLQRLNKPRSLPCFHTFCESCLKNYLINAPEKEHATKDGIPCPTCKLVTYSPKPAISVGDWAEHFPMNHLVGTLIDIVPVTSRLEFCEPCKEDQQSKVARSWCQQCAEALCEDCAKCHKSMKATRKHEVTPLENVRSNPQPTISVEEVPCSEHSKKDVDMYCQDHEVPACAICIATDHRKCDKIFQMSEIIKTQRPYDSTKLLKEIDGLVGDADKVKRERQDVMRNTHAQKTRMLKEIAEAKEKLIKHIERLESQITAKFNAVSQTDFAILQEQIDYCNSVQSAMHHAKTSIQATQEQKLPKKEFIVIQKGKKKYDDCSEGLKKIHENSAKIQYLFDEDRQVAETVGAIAVLGKLDVKHSYPNRKPLTPLPQPSPASPAAPPSSSGTLGTAGAAGSAAPAAPMVPEVEDGKKAAKKMKTFNAKVKGDKRDCRISSIHMWNSKKILLADNINSRLKLFGDFGDLLCAFDCTHPPWDISFTEKNKCAVTFPGERKIRMFRIKESITEIGYIQTTRGCHGIAYADGDLATTYANGCIRVIGLDGTVKMMVDTDYIGKRVFSNPEYVAFNNFSSRIYVSDYNNHTVTALQLEGGKVDKTPLFVYPVSGPRGVNVDSHGHVYVCGFWSNDIHKITSGGELRQILMDTLSRPLFLTFSPDGEKFAMSEQGNPNVVKVFKVVVAENEDEY